MDNRLFCRIYQLCAALLLRIRPVKKGQLITGEGCLADAAQLFSSRRIDKVGIITTAGTLRRGTLAPLLKRFAELDIRYAVFDGVKPDPDIVCIDAAAELLLREGCRGIIAVGGGSAMDCAKMAAAKAACPGKSVIRMKGLMKIHRKLPFLAAVPTTAGKGSEITAAAVVTDSGRDYKFTVMDFCIVPEAAVLDPALTAGLPADITAETGMDAFTHAIEAYTNRFASAKTNGYAMEAIKLINENLPAAVKDGGNMAARENMLMGSYYAGIAFTNGYVGYVHALAHAIGGMYHIPHGRACAVMLPEVLESYGDSIDVPMARVADALGIGGADDEAKKTALIAHIRNMIETAGISCTIEELREEDIPELASRAAAEANPAYPVPKILNRIQLENVIRKKL